MKQNANKNQNMEKDDKSKLLEFKIVLMRLNKEISKLNGVEMNITTAEQINQLKHKNQQIIDEIIREELRK